jgi:hypothetical protein
LENRHSALFDPRAAPNIGQRNDTLVTSVRKDRCTEDDLACLDPVCFGCELRLHAAIVPEDYRLLLFEPVHIADGLASGSVYGTL